MAKNIVLIPIVFSTFFALGCSLVPDTVESHEDSRLAYKIYRYGIKEGPPVEWLAVFGDGRHDCFPRLGAESAGTAEKCHFGHASGRAQSVEAAGAAIKSHFEDYSKRISPVRPES